MAFCSNCGAELQGKFCAKCGTPAAADAGQSPPPQSPPQQSPPQQPLPPPVAAGLTENVAAALCYLLLILTGILFLVLQPYNQNRTIRFHALQSIFVWIAAVICYAVVSVFGASLGALPFIGFLFTVVLNLVVALGFLVLWLMLMYKAYNNQRWVLPVVGPLAEKHA